MFMSDDLDQAKNIGFRGEGMYSDACRVPLSNRIPPVAPQPYLLFCRFCCTLAPFRLADTHACVALFLHFTCTFPHNYMPKSSVPPKSQSIRERLWLLAVFLVYLKFAALTLQST